MHSILPSPTSYRRFLRLLKAMLCCSTATLSPSATQADQRTSIVSHTCQFRTTNQQIFNLYDAHSLRIGPIARWFHRITISDTTLFSSLCRRPRTRFTQQRNLPVCCQICPISLKEPFHLRLYSARAGHYTTQSTRSAQRQQESETKH